MEKILIVEDDVYVRENLFQLLSLEGYDVVAAEDGHTALEIIKNTKTIDLIISDIMMPNLNGHELLKKLRENKTTELIPLIFLSAKTNNEDIRTGMNIGADDYVTKPYSVNEILSTIKTRLQKQKAQQTVLSDLKENITKYVPHELRTPLVSILGFSDYMLENLETLTITESKNMLNLIKKSGLRLSEWVEKFIFYTDIETNLTNDKQNQIEEKNSCEIKDIKWEEHFEKNRAWSERKNDIKIDMGEARLKIKESNLNFLIKELVENSAKFSNPGTHIKAKGIKNGKYYKMYFSDEGVGFSDETMKRITAFQQFEREKIQQYGNGLGLAIVNKIVFTSNGSIELKSKKNVSTMFSIKIPLVQNVEQQN